MSQIVIDNKATLTSPKLMMQAADTNFTELYTLAASQGTKINRLGELVGVDVTDFGAVGDGTTDDRAAIQLAIDSLSSTGGIVNLPVGTYKISSALVLNTNGVTLLGQGRQASILSISSATANAIEIGNYTTLTKNNRVSNLQITSSVTKTAGAAIKIMNGHQTDIDRITLMSKMYYGFQFEGGTSQYIYHLSEFEINSGVCGIIVGADAAASGGICQGLVCTDGDIANLTGVAIKLIHVSGAMFRNIDVISSYTGVGMLPGANQQVVACWFDTVLGDTCTNNGWTIQPQSSTGKVQEIMMTSCWGASCSNYGILIDPYSYSSTVSGVALTGCRFMHNVKHGVYIQSGVSALSFSNLHCLGNSTAGSGTYHGIYLQSGVSGVTFTGGVSGVGGLFTNYQGYGIYFDGTATRCSVVGMNVYGNITGAIRDTGVTAGATIKIVGCVGHTTRASGYVNIAASASTVVVSHYLASTPILSDITVTMQTNPTASVTGGFYLWVTNITSTTFKINASATMTTACIIGWTAETR